MTTVALSLISHTNVGKTTLARTLLRRDVGEVRDATHVTLLAARHTLFETDAGDRLELWDTPGFGDSVRLLRRLEQSGNPLGWFLSHVWDRYADRAFFSSQQALRNVRDQADVVLYLVNASEDEAASAYVEPEMRILDWVGKPVLVLLNQLGPPDGAREARDLERWTARMFGQPNVRRVLALDAFARCWVHEHVLLDRIAAVLPTDKQAGYARISGAWQARNRQVFEQSMQVLGRQLVATALDSEPLRPSAMAGTARTWLASLIRGREAGDPVTERAMARLAERLDEQVRRSTDGLIVLHGLSGRASAQILERVRADFDVNQALDPGKAGLIGAAVSGALGGLAADLAAGGLTLGAGALIGGLLGAAGSHGFARAYNTARGGDSNVVRWSPEFLAGRVTAAVLRYLAVAHYGRGRGDYVESECPPQWKPLVERAISATGGVPDALRSPAADPLDGPRSTDPVALERVLAVRLDEIVSTVLRELYG